MTPTVEPDALAQELMALEVEAGERRGSSDFVDHPVRWDGAPTKSALRALELESRTPGFDAAVARLILERMADGETLTAACGVAGVRRSVVLAWRKLEPRFDEMVSVFETELGGYARDKAMEFADKDAAVSGAYLKVASAYDRRIAKGESDVNVGFVVQVSR